MLKRFHLSTLFGLLAIACHSPNDTQDKQTTAAVSVHPYSEPIWVDSVAFSRLQSAFTVVEKIYLDYASEHHFPSIAFGVVANGNLVYSGSTGWADVQKKTPATAKTYFRIASMSKSFASMAILQLRDQGKLSLADPVERYIPEMAKAGALTKDAPRITIQHLMTMAAGFPEDNPWGDRQLDDTDQELLDLVGNGLSFSNVPGVSFEYSNLGYALLGLVITKVSGQSYQTYIDEHILKPLGMNAAWEFSKVPPEQLAMGYEWLDNQWKEVPMLHDGAYGAMGGLICSIEDFSKYMALHMQAWPPRDEADKGPLQRSSIREMHQPWRFNNLFVDAKSRTGAPCPQAVGYGYGLGWRKDCKGVVRISHSGGLPGFGSEWRFYPEFGIGVVSFSNHTYGAPGAANAMALDTLIAIAQLKPRSLLPSQILQKRKEQLVRLLPSWEGDTTALFAENFFADESMDRRKAVTLEVWNRIGAVREVGNVIPENQLRGSFDIVGERGVATVFFTLTPEREARIQQLDVNLRP